MKATIYQRRMMNADGSMSTVAKIAADMRRAGTDQRLIDRWLQGLTLSASS